MMPSNYLETVQDIAREALEKETEEEREWFVDESVDGSEFIIYPNMHERVLTKTHNEPDAAEVRAMSGPNATWKEMRAKAAFLAMKADVMEELRHLEEEGEEEEDDDDDDGEGPYGPLRRYRIENARSGVVLGIYEGVNEDDAILAMHRDAGYDSTEEVARVLGKTVEQLTDELVVEEV